MDITCKPITQFPVANKCLPIMAVNIKGTTKKRLCFPAVCFKSYWTGYSSNVVDLPVNTSFAASFSLENMQKYRQQDYVMAVRDGANHWKLWQGSNEVLPLPLYGGQLLSNKAVFELWTCRYTPEAFTTPAFCVDMINYSCCGEDTGNPLVATLKQKFLGICGHAPYPYTQSAGPFLFALTNPC